MKAKSIMFSAAAALCATASATTPEVTSVTMSQASSSRLVTINYIVANAPAVVTLDVETNANTSAEADDPGWTPIGGEAVCNAQGDVWKIVGPEGGTFNGTITWRPDLSWPDHKIADGGARAVVTAWALDNTPDYMVVDITSTAATNSQCYYPAVDYLPGGILSNTMYRTTTIVMRKIMAKDVKWTRGSTFEETQRLGYREEPHQVTLTNNYYIGVFPVTQTQWGLIQTSKPKPSYFQNSDDCEMRPVEWVSYNEIRNAANSSTANPTYDWPHDPNPGSFLGLLRKKTGIDFDLPSESQWEFAARAGNGDTKWGDGTTIKNTSVDANLDLYGRYASNGGKYADGTTPTSKACGPTNATAIVGSYRPNSWGLYDMAGNVQEWCLDWHADNVSGINGKVNIDPENPANTLSGNPTTGTLRARRGGIWSDPSEYCRPAFRGGTDPTYQQNGLGFRLACTAGLQ